MEHLNVAPRAPEEFLHERLLAVTSAQLLACFTRPERLERWWGPAGFTNRFEVCEPRPGGAWRFTMVAPHGAEYPNESRFVEVGPGRVVIEHVVKPLFTLTVTWREEPGGCRVWWRQRFESEAVREAIAAIVGTSNEENLDRLEAEARTA